MGLFFTKSFLCLASTALTVLLLYLHIQTVLLHSDEKGRSLLRFRNIPLKPVNADFDNKAKEDAKLQAISKGMEEVQHRLEFIEDKLQSLSSQLPTKFSEESARQLEPIKKVVESVKRDLKMNKRVENDPKDKIVSERPIAQGFGLVLTCHSSDTVSLAPLLESLAKQTVTAQESVFVFCLGEDKKTGVPFIEFNSPEIQPDETEITIERIERQLNQTAESFWKEQFKNYRRKFDSFFDPLEKSISSIRNLKLYIRAGNYLAGANRVYGEGLLGPNITIASFFDCDDVMHRERTEILYKMFQRRPELEVLTHSYMKAKTDMNRSEVFNLRDSVVPDDQLKLVFNYTAIHENLPHSQLPWDINDPSTEVNWEGQPNWFFPVNYRSPRANYKGYHNGWITVRRKVFKEVKYPETLARGQDSLYNWRLIRSKKMFNAINAPLGLYVMLPVAGAKTVTANGTLIYT